MTLRRPLVTIGGAIKEIPSGDTVDATPAQTLVYANTTVPAGNTVASSAAETAFTSSYTIPANALSVGMVLRLKAFGTYGTTAVAPTLRGKIKFGSTVMLDTGALTTVLNTTNQGWSAEAQFICQTIGATGTIESQGFAEFATAATTGLSVNIDNTAPITIDTTASQVLTMTVQWSASDAANTITLRELTVDAVTISPIAGSSAVLLIANNLSDVANAATARSNLAAAALAANTFTGTQTLSGAVVNLAKGASVASSAATSDIWATTGNTVHITGTTDMSGLPAAPQAGVWRTLYFDGALKLTNGANFVVQGGADYTTSAGDVVDVYADTTTKFYLFLRRVGGTREILTANRTYYVRAAVGTVTMTIASPCVVSLTAHGLTTNDPVVFTTTGALPTGLTIGTVYYVISAGLTANAFEVSATLGGSAVNTSGSQSGTHSAQTGNDSNSGLAQTRAGAFLTMQQAVNVVAGTLDISIYTVTIQSASTVYSSTVACGAYVGSGSIILQGDTTTPANCIISTTSVDAISNACNRPYTVQGFRLKTTTSGSGLSTSGGGSKISYNNVDFGACSTAQLNASNCGELVANGNYSISGGSAVHAQFTEGGQLVVSGRTVTLTGTPAFSVAYAYGRNCAAFTGNGCTFSGSATGSRYSINNVSSCFVNGAATTYFPGNSAGTTASGGQYI